MVIFSEYLNDVHDAMAVPPESFEPLPPGTRLGIDVATFDIHMGVTPRDWMVEHYPEMASEEDDLF